MIVLRWAVATFQSTSNVPIYTVWQLGILIIMACLWSSNRSRPIGRWFLEGKDFFQWKITFVKMLICLLLHVLQFENMYKKYTCISWFLKKMFSTSASLKIECFWHWSIFCKTTREHILSHVTHTDLEFESFKCYETLSDKSLNRWRKSTRHCQRIEGKHNIEDVSFAEESEETIFS